VILVDGVLRILDGEEGEVTSFKAIHADALRICKETGSVLDLAVSDVDLYLETSDLDVAKRVAVCYSPSLKVERVGPKEYRIFWP